MLAESFYAELEKHAGIGRSAAKGAAVGAGITGAYGALREAVNESRKRGKKRYGRAALEGFLKGAPTGATVGGAIGAGHHVYRKGEQAFDAARDDYHKTMRKMQDMVDEGTHGARDIRDAVKNMDRNLSQLNEDKHRGMGGRFIFGKGQKK